MPYPHMAMVVAAFVVVVGFEAFEYDVYVVFLGKDVGEVFNLFQYVAGDIGRAFGVDGYFGTRTDVFQSVFIVFVAGLPRKPKLPFTDWYSTYTHSFSKAACSFPTRKSCALLPIASAILQNGREIGRASCRERV